MDLVRREQLNPSVEVEPRRDYPFHIRRNLAPDEIADPFRLVTERGLDREVALELPEPGVSAVIRISDECRDLVAEL